MNDQSSVWTAPVVNAMPFVGIFVGCSWPLEALLPVYRILM